MQEADIRDYNAAGGGKQMRSSSNIEEQVDQSNRASVKDHHNKPSNIMQEQDIRDYNATGSGGKQMRSSSHMEE